MKFPLSNNSSDRLESLKAGVLCAIAVTLTHLPLAYTTQTDAIDLLLRMAIVAFSGVLFGMTYRYAVRRDRNSHLKSGVVLAFGFVRGLAQIENAIDPRAIELSLFLYPLESLGLFAIAGLLLDIALQRRWIEPMG
ncbi:hypothetical protein CKA32_004031 [Geitlerinema sp. FC II]|uniref:hypothetical protein n=1 Tax=Baaleninema simplex TaxID=2862350 RepID=UPI00034D1C47|nr:hypothetical protein [Baaleninema simplex]MDC0834517.1 hypothetical protein [Geitlerinema sp. CS-897]PPT10112.1 hypothetical protein CKA32_004031 [Geitlerinema sp. FC II]